MKTLRILLVDDHEVVRLGIKALLSRYESFHVVAEASNAEEALARALHYQPDVIIMDVRLEGQSGIEATRTIKAALPQVEVIMLTSSVEEDVLEEAIRAGASGYVPKQIEGDSLVRALTAVQQGEALLDSQQARRLASSVRAAERATEDSVFAELTEQEMRVLSLLAEGRSNKEIAQHLHLSSGTVRNYVSNLLQKMGVSNRAAAAVLAVEHRIKDHLPPQED